MGFKGPPFTWEGRGIKERIDRGVCNHDWWHSFPISHILHLPKLKSDHKPFLLRLQGVSYLRRFSRCFWLVERCLRNDDFHNMLKGTGEDNDDLFENSNNFRRDALIGNIFHKKRVDEEVGR
ncbi:unnamed protein product [Lupinus luteus]|uniref:Uncharacterized protein n=1 Tax=Lupinus luteus TaxID=3873 RepID=A0AAV1WAD0_LUPLU